MANTIMTGNLGRDPELRETAQGDTVTTFSLAHKERKNTIWYEVTCWGKLAETAAGFLKKGSKILLTGGAVTGETFEKRDGTKGFSLKITAKEFEFLDRKEEQEESPFKEDFANELGL